MHGPGIAGGFPTSVRCVIALAVTVFLMGVGYPARADFFDTVEISGDTSIASLDGSHLFSETGDISSDPGAFPYVATFTYDLSNINLTSPSSTVTNFGQYAGPMRATFTALGQSFSITDPNGSLALNNNANSTLGTDLYSQRATNGVATLDVAAAPTSGNPIANGGAGQKFRLSSASLSGPFGTTRTIFSEGDTNLILNINQVDYIGPGNAILQGAVHYYLDGNNPKDPNNLPTQMHGIFTPNGNLSLTQAANDLGYTNFDWKQTIINHPGGLKQFNGAVLTKNFNDYPPGGYEYCNANPDIAGGDCSHRFPFYYDDTELQTGCAMSLRPPAKGCNINVVTTTKVSDDTLNFYDAPGDQSLPPGQEMQFKTRLAGTTIGFDPNSTVDCLDTTPATCVDTGFGFDWSDTYNYTVGGISVPGSAIPVDPGGTGGITVTGFFDGSPAAMPEPPTILLVSPICILFFYRRYSRKEKCRAITSAASLRWSS